jgi:xylulokinase
MASGGAPGSVTEHAAQETGLRAGTPVIVGSGDSVAEAFGIGAIEPGAAIFKLGTAANVNMVTAQPLASKQSITYRHVVPGQWFTIAPTNSGASTMRWFRDTFCRLEMQQAEEQGISVYTLIDQLASGSPPGADGLLFHPYLMGERTPHWNPHLRASFTGISTRHNAHHFARAILEGVAYSIRECLDVVRALGQPITRSYLIGGGARSRLWREVLCSVLGVPLEKPAVEDAAFGSALLAGVGIGAFTSMDEAVIRCVRIEERLTPDMEQHALYNDYFAVYSAIARDKAAHDQALARLADRYTPPLASEA